MFVTACRSSLPPVSCKLPVVPVQQPDRHQSNLESSVTHHQILESANARAIEAASLHRKSGQRENWSSHRQPTCQRAVKPIVLGWRQASHPTSCVLTYTKSSPLGSINDKNKRADVYQNRIVSEKTHVNQDGFGADGNLARHHWTEVDCMKMSDCRLSSRLFPA